MSTNTIEAFRAKVAKDPDLQAEVKASVVDDSLVALAKRHGFDFTAAELQAFFADAELTELELDLVAGGCVEYSHA